MDEEDWQDWGHAHEVSDHLLHLIWRIHWKKKPLKLPPWVKSIVDEHFEFSLPTIAKSQESQDGTVKFLLTLDDGLNIEMVIVPFPGRHTLCLSTQVGCAMSCRFCFTATQGLKRQLTHAEIVGQYLVGWNWLREHRPQFSAAPKIVFMGQGEPLHNFDQVKKSLGPFLSRHMVALGPRSITLSTVGYLPGLKRLPELPMINLALSLHSPFDEQRNQLIPINQRYPLHEILPYFDARPQLKRQFINFEYLLIDSFNDSSAHVEALAELLRNRPGIVNIIPYNFVPGLPWKRPSFDQAHEFQKALRKKGTYATVRTTKGEEIMAACGQLQTAQSLATATISL